MKIRLPKDYRQHFTLEDMEHVNVVRESEKEDDSTAKELLEQLAWEILRDTTDCPIEAVTAEAEFQKNGRIWDHYGLDDHSGNMDVWISGLCKTTDGYLEAGGYLSDIWQIGAVEIKEHTYSRRFIQA